MPLSIIAAMGKNHVIGDDRGLPWRLPKDLRRFKDCTWGKPVIMGRKTMELIGRPLPGRDNVVLTRNYSYREQGFHVAHDVQAALVIAHWLLKERGGDEVMVIGGGEVYRQFLPLADRVYLTVVDGEFAGTATFPFDEMAALPWNLRQEELSAADEHNPHGQRFVVLDRLREGDHAGRFLEPLRLLAS